MHLNLNLYFYGNKIKEKTEKNNVLFKEILGVKLFSKCKRKQLLWSHTHTHTLDESGNLTAFLRWHFLHNVQRRAVLIVHNVHVNTCDRRDTNQDQMSIYITLKVLKFSLQ